MPDRPPPRPILFHASPATFRTPARATNASAPVTTATIVEVTQPATEITPTPSKSATGPT